MYVKLNVLSFVNVKQKKLINIVCHNKQSDHVY